MQQHFAVLRGHKDQRPRSGVEQFKPLAGFLRPVIPQRFGDDVSVLGQPVTEGTGPVQNGGERRVPLVDKVGRRQRRLDGTHDAEPQNQHHRNGGEKLPADGIAATHSRTSNL